MMSSRSVNAGAHGLTVRARVLIYIVALTAVALAVTGTTAFLIERDAVRTTITTELAAAAQGHLAHIAQEGTLDADIILREALGRHVATATEGALGLIDGQPRFVSAAPTRLNLEDDAELVAAASAVSSDQVAVHRVATAVTDYAYAAVPLVDDAGTHVATLIIATDEGARLTALAQTFAVYAAVAAVALAAIGAFGFFTVGRLLEPVRLLDTTARHITDTDLSQRVPIVGDDDLASLSGTVNAMLDRLEEAFAAQRRLLDDASHELRTPLTVIRTRLELLEPRDPEQVEATRDELLAVSEDMSRLVGDLVTLAKADRPEFLRITPAAIPAFTQAAFARMTALGTRAWELTAVAEGEATVDAQRLTQAWSQLAANAVKFSAPGSAVEVASARDGDYLLLSVTDHGRGIAPADIPRIRERFIRLDPEVEGAGLGLPIVTAIARAHGGGLEVSSQVGEGSTFTIRVPWETSE